ncbi:MAG: LytTR family DNA-binding domain-containing protein [Bacteroidetes bacterium]|nr:LytTR family DNA-binding domain-containing protein [Bacteroidota bacterium]
MKLNCLIIDDEPMAVKVIQNHLKEFPDITVVNTFQHPLEALSVIESNSIDLIFLDINMPKITGLDFLKSISIKPHVIITTAYREFAVESFELDVADYLIKPIPFARFLKAIDKVRHLIQLEKGLSEPIVNKPHIFIKSDKKLIKVYLSEILFVESLKDYIKISTTAGDFLVLRSITSIEEELPNEYFLRIHRSFIVSVEKVKAVEGNTVEVSNRKIPIGRNYLKDAKRIILHITEDNEKP